MSKMKMWLILLSISLIALDRYSFIGYLRDSVVIWMQKQTGQIIYRAQNYPRLVLLQVNQQQVLANQNAQLKKQVEEYSLLLKQSKNQNQDIQAISQLNSQDLYDDFTVTVVKAILDVNFFMNNQLLIDSGTNKAINIGNAVVNKDGVI
ncbi:MAG: hypothetical protein RLZZ293_679, partial [Pseudomonadota bacterium]